MPANRPASIELAHESPLVVAGLRHILGACPEFELRAPGDPGRSGNVPADRPDLVIVDPHGALCRAARRRRDGLPDDRLLVVALAGQDVDVRGALEAGIRGVVMAGCPNEEIVQAARAVAAGRRHLCAAASQRIADSMAQPTLTTRESEVLALVSRGCNNKVVARELGISVGTVKAHMRGLLSKLGARCRTEAVWIASERGLASRLAGAGAGAGAGSASQQVSAQAAFA